jgi:hypothetical protein
MIYHVQQQNLVYLTEILRFIIIFLGTAALGTIVNLTAVGNLHVDIVVVASVVVNPISGARLGKRISSANGWLQKKINLVRTEKTACTAIMEKYNESLSR